MSLEFDDFISQINYVIDAKSEESLMSRWISGYQNISLEDFKQNLGYRKPSEAVIFNRPIESVLDELVYKFG